MGKIICFRLHQNQFCRIQFSSKIIFVLKNRYQGLNTFFKVCGSIPNWFVEREKKSIFECANLSLSRWSLVTFH